MLLLATAFVCGMVTVGHLDYRLLLVTTFTLWLLSVRGLMFAPRAGMPILILGFVAMGGTFVALDEASIGNDRIRRQIERGLIAPEEPVLLQAEVATAPELAPDRLYLDVDAESVVQTGVERSARGRIRLLISFNDGEDRRDYDALGLEYAQRLRVLCHLRRPPGYQNPGSPSFHALLDQRGLDAMASIRSPLLIEVLGRGDRSSALHLLYSVRSAAIRSLLRTVSQPTSGLLIAAILGNHNFLDRRVAEAFRSGGTYHLLVISGLHIALIASSLLLVTRVMLRGRVVRILLVVGVIWTFAIMVGAQPAVTRAAVRVPDFGESSAFVYGVYFLVVIGLVHMLSRWNPLALHAGPGRTARRIAGARFGTLVIVWVFLVWIIVDYPFEHRFDRGRLSLTLLDVGQGESMVISFPRGALMLLDAGGRLSLDDAGDDNATRLFIEDRPGIGELAIAPFLWRRGVTRIDVIAATHGDADHVQGFDDIISSFVIGQALSGPRLEGEDGHLPFPEAISRRAAGRRTVARGDSFEIDDVRVDVLAPFAEMRSPRFSQNDRSLVVRLTYGERRFLLTGDIEGKTEALLLRSGEDLHADVLKVAHHGSRTSSDREFLTRVAPAYALISAGSPSPFGHPHTEVIGRLREKNARILTTGSCGAITISTDGRDLVHETFVKCE